MVVGAGGKPKLGKETIYESCGYSRKGAVTEKSLINYCGVERNRGGGTACSSGGCVDGLPMMSYSTNNY